VRAGNASLVDGAEGLREVPSSVAEMKHRFVDEAC